MKQTIKTLAMTAVILTLGAGAALAQCVATVDGSGIQTQTLFAGQTIEAGTVSIEVVGDNLQVTYDTIDGWELMEAHLWVGNALSDMPQTRKGNPKIGNFPYNSGDISGQVSYAFDVALANLGFSCPGEDKDLFVAAHAALRRPDGSGGYQTETGWGSGDRVVEKGSWATYFMTTLTCDCGGGNGGGPASCETAFALVFEPESATCFLDIDEDGDGNRDFSRWGWTNGPLGPGNYSFDIYAGAGQCDINKGTFVGTLTVDYDGSTATVNFETVGGFSIKETHLYVGNDLLASDNGEFTVAPGQYPYTKSNLDDVLSDTYVANNLSGDIYVVAHSVVCGEYPE